VFNSLDLLPFYFSQVVDILRKFQQKTLGSTPVIAVEGNHDIRSFSKGNRIATNLSWLKVLSNLGLITLLDENLENPDRNSNPICVNEVKVYGNTYCGERIDESTEQILKNIPQNNGFNILINHFGIQGQMKGIPGQSKYILDEKLKPSINYLGTGHFHKQYLLDDYVYNPGCLSPACLSDFNLPHGYFLVDVCKDKGFSIKVTKKRVQERRLLWKNLTLKSKSNSLQQLYVTIIDLLKKDRSLHKICSTPIPQDALPVLCLTLRSPTGKLLSGASKKEIRSIILQNFPVVECHIFQKQIQYKPIEGFFLSSSCSAWGLKKAFP
jgi:DNA repair exonuclease SbcCD nuclease subunit